ncbi:MAG: enoyl-CoA hydratase-related protein [Chloroflexota bacterium]|nr:enoyl-CoA hydratase-related protein [Chloroflexota bacterium]
MDFEQIIYDKSDGIATITLNRPERMNAFTNRMLEEWATALADARDDDDVRVVVVTGAGLGFCSGMDVRETEAGRGLWDPQASLAQRRHFLRDSVHRVPRTVATLDKPYIAAVNGAAVGAGMDMASMCDIRIAADSARFSMAYVRMGLIPGDGGCYFLPRIVGLAKAVELIWTGDIIDAQEALRIGYVSQVVAADQLMQHTREFALRLARGPAVAIQAAKRLVYRSLETNLNHALELAESAMLVCQTTEDAREGPRAFVEKREPQFKGR